MAELKVNISELDNAIQLLRELKDTCDNLNLTPPPTEGSGKVVQQMENISNAYITVRDSMSILLSNSIVFFQNIRDSYDRNDHYMYLYRI